MISFENTRFDIDDNEIELAIKNQDKGYDDGSVVVGNIFNFDNKEYQWLENIKEKECNNGEIWALYKVTELDNDTLYYFIVETETGYIETYYTDRYKANKEYNDIVDFANGMGNNNYIDDNGNELQIILDKIRNESYNEDDLWLQNEIPINMNETLDNGMKRYQYYNHDGYNYVYDYKWNDVHRVHKVGNKYYTIDYIGLNVDNWKHKGTRDEYLFGWELEFNSDMQDMLSYGMEYYL